MTIFPLGDSAVIVSVTEPHAPEAAVRVQAWTAGLQAKKVGGVLDIVPSFATVTVFFDPARVERDADKSARETICGWIRQLGDDIATTAPSPFRMVEIPVCYAPDFAPDMNVVSHRAGVSPEEVVRIHSGPVYEVRAVGFSPGFPYLGGLPEILHTPRRATPRMAVPAGSIGIGGAQTGVYPLPTPGGWNLIGRTPLALFLPEENPPSLLSAGDRVRFVPIDPHEFERLSR